VTWLAVADRLGQHRAATDGDVSSRERALDPGLHEFLAGVELHRLLKLAIREVRKPELLAADSGVTLDVAVPWLDVSIPDRPVYAIPVLQVRLEIEVAPPVGLAAPDERASSHLVPLNPGERLLLDIGMLAVLLKEMDASLDELTGARLNLIVLGERALWRDAPLAHRELEVPLVLGDVILLMLDVASALEHERAKAFLAQLLGGPSPADAGAHDDGVVLFALLKKHGR
jgi:hypothetical protein